MMKIYRVRVLANAYKCLQRPFANYYGLAFILYELSTPFLNFHWFFDKLGMTGSRPQLYNGIVLLVTFGSCRLVWGVYQSVRIYQDMWKALQSLDGPIGQVAGEGVMDTVKGAMREERLPVILAGFYVASNTILVVLNFYWFGKMIEAIAKRFRKPAGRKERKE